MLRVLAVAGALALCGCGARTAVSPGGDAGDGGAPRDARGDATDAASDARPPRDTGLPPLDAGDGCLRDSDCEPLSCVRDADVGAVDLEPIALTCDELSAGGRPGAHCEGGDECDHGLCLVAGTCVEPCARHADCPAGQRCAEVYARTAEEALQPLHACIDRDNLPRDVGLRRERLPGALEAGAPGGSRVQLEPGEGTTLWVLQPSAGEEGFVQRLATRSADPTVLFDLGEIDRSDSPAPRNGVWPLGSFDAPYTLQVPNGPRAVLSRSGYDADVVADRDGDLEVTTAWRVGSGRELSLDFYYVGAHDLEPAGEALPPLVAEAVDRMLAIWSPAGLRLGDIRQHEVVGGLRERLQIIEAERRGGSFTLPDLPRLLSLSAGAGRPTVSVFLVRSMDVALGVSGGIPGPHGIHGTGASGLAIGVDVLGDPELPEDLDLGRVLAHEVGHFLGLFHTSEAEGLLLEPLPDTPACRLDRDADGDGQLRVDECEGAGADNLMFWAAGGETTTPEQHEVVRRALVLQ